MIEKRIFNRRAYDLAVNYAKQNHTKIYVLLNIDDTVYAVQIENESYLEQIPQFYTEYLFFWFRTVKALIRRYKDRIIFVQLPDFLQILNENS